MYALSSAVADVTLPNLHELQSEKYEGERSDPLTDGLRIEFETWLTGLYIVLGVDTPLILVGLATENTLWGLEP